MLIPRGTPQASTGWTDYRGGPPVDVKPIGRRRSNQTPQFFLGTSLTLIDVGIIIQFSYSG